MSEEGKGSNERPGSESGASADAISTTIRGLKAASRYGVTVRAYNAAGTGPLTPPHFRHTLESRKYLFRIILVDTCKYATTIHSK